MQYQGSDLSFCLKHLKYNEKHIKQCCSDIGQQEAENSGHWKKEGKCGEP